MSAHVTNMPAANLEAEQALLGALLVDNSSFEHVAKFIAPEHFFDPIHGRIYAAIRHRIEREQRADPLTVCADLTDTGTLEEVGGGVYLDQLVSATNRGGSPADHGRQIYDCWRLRQPRNGGVVPVLLHPRELELLADALRREARAIRQNGDHETADLVEARRFVFGKWARGER